MTLYLWHIPPLLRMHLVFDYLGHPRYDPTAPGFIVLSVCSWSSWPSWLPRCSSCCARWRTTRCHCGTAATWPATGSRSAAVGALLCVAGAATLASVGWGLKGPGLYCVAVMLAALVGARFLATDQHVTAQRVCAASLPASTR